MIGEEFSEVLAGAKIGSERSIVRLWRDLHPLLLGYLRAMDRAVADDVESETWLRVARGLERFEGGEPEFRGWVFTIARRRMIDWGRAAGRRPRRTVPLEDLPDGAAGVVHDPAVITEENFDTDRVLALLRELPSDQAEVILLRVLSGLSTARVGAIVGKRPGAVRVLQHRGLRRLAELLNAHSSERRAVTR
jgi:RNA polymerase sigma-70 factor, ECF subfamily